MAFHSPLSSCESYDTTGGRQVYRRIELFENKAVLPKGWSGIQRLIRVRRWGLRQQTPFESVSFYVLSAPVNSASQVAQLIQGHWAIENRLHWTKDVLFNEDRMHPRSKQLATSIAYLNNLAINILKLNGYKPSADAFAFFSNNITRLAQLFLINP